MSLRQPQRGVNHTTCRCGQMLSRGTVTIPDLTHKTSFFLQPCALHVVVAVHLWGCSARLRRQSRYEGAIGTHSIGSIRASTIKLLHLRLSVRIRCCESGRRRGSEGGDGSVITRYDSLASRLKAARRHRHCCIWGNSIITSAVVSSAPFNDRSKTSHGTFTPQPTTTRLIITAKLTNHDLT